MRFSILGALFSLGRLLAALGLAPVVALAFLAGL